MVFARMCSLLQFQAFPLTYSERYDAYGVLCVGRPCDNTVRIPSGTYHYAPLGILMTDVHCMRHFPSVVYVSL